MLDNKTCARKKQKHKKSKTGCLNCRKRRIKCGEELDMCFNCVDRGLPCSFKSLTHEQRRQLIQSKKASQSDETGAVSSRASPTCEPMLDAFDTKLQETIGTGFLYSVTQVPWEDPGSHENRAIGPSELLFTEWDVHRNTEVSYRGEYGEMVGTPKVSPNSAQFSKVSPLQLSPPPASPNATRGSLPHAARTAKTFCVVPAGPADFAASVNACHVYDVCGETSPRHGAFRKNMSHWFDQFVVSACTDLLTFHTILFRSCSVVLKELRSRGSEPSDLARLQQVYLCHESVSIREAQHAIRRINEYQHQRDFENMMSVLVGLARFSACAFLSNLHSPQSSIATFSIFSTFVNGFVSSVSMMQMDSRKYGCRYESLVQFCYKYHSEHITSVCLPNYTPAAVSEFVARIQDFHAYALAHQDVLHMGNAAVQNLSSLHALAQQTPHTREAWLSYETAVPVAKYDPLRVVQLVNEMYNHSPGELVFLEDRQACFAPFEAIVYLAHLCYSALMDNVSPETFYFFQIRFSTVVNFNGCSTQFVQHVRDELHRRYAKSAPSVCEYGTRLLIYLVRTTSFLRFRFASFLNNVKFHRLYPDNANVEAIRFDSRKLPQLREQQVPRFANCALNFDNYLQRNPHFVPPSPAQDPYYAYRPYNTANVFFYDDGYANDANRDGAYAEVQEQLRLHGHDLEKVPLEFLQFGKGGMLKNIDFRSEISNSPEMLCESTQENGISRLRLYVKDRAMIWNRFIESKSQSKSGALGGSWN